LIWLTIRRGLAALVAVAMLSAICGAERVRIKRKKASADTREAKAEEKKQQTKKRSKQEEQLARFLRDEYWRDSYLKFFWNHRIPTRPVHSAVGAHNLMIIDHEHWIFALERERGVVRWKGEIGEKVNSMTVGADEVMVLCRDRLHRIDEDRGKQYWVRPLPFPPCSQVVRSQFRICAGGWGRKIFGLDIENCHPIWQFRAKDNVLGRIVDSGVRVYAVTESGHVYALDAPNGTEEWSLDIGGRIIGGVAVDGHRVYCGSTDGVLFACSKLGEGVLWRFLTKGPIVRTPIVKLGAVYFSAEEALYVVDTKGKLLWKVDGADVSILAITRKRVYLLKGTNTILALNKDTGEQYAAVEVPGFDMFPQNLDGPEIFCISKVTGDILALKEL
jgi:outer membrane protein assembly factor BamB